MDDKTRTSLAERLNAEYRELTERIVKAEIYYHKDNARPYRNTHERELNTALGEQINIMKRYRVCLMRRMALLNAGIDDIL